MEPYNKHVQVWLLFINGALYCYVGAIGSWAPWGAIWASEAHLGRSETVMAHLWDVVIAAAHQKAPC